MRGSRPDLIQLRQFILAAVIITGLIGIIAGVISILALDMYEHSYHIDFGAKAAAYVDTYMAAIQWKKRRSAIHRNFGETRGAIARLVQMEV